MMNWKDFYSWLNSKDYEIVRNSNIFRGDKFITSFDPQEDDDSGEITETVLRIKKNDPFNFKI